MARPRTLIRTIKIVSPHNPALQIGFVRHYYENRSLWNPLYYLLGPDVYVAYIDNEPVGESKDLLSLIAEAQSYYEEIYFIPVERL